MGDLPASLYVAQSEVPSGCHSPNGSSSSSTYSPSDTVSFHEEIKSALGYQNGPFEARANNIYEVPFRSWLNRSLEERGKIAKKEAINSGAEVTGCSIKTTDRYLRKLTSEAGPFQEVLDEISGVVVIVRKRDQ